MFKARLLLANLLLICLLLLGGYYFLHESQPPEYPSRAVFSQIHRGMTKHEAEALVGRPAKVFAERARHFHGGWLMEDGCRIEFEMDKGNGQLTWKRLIEPSPSNLLQHCRTWLGW